MKKSTLWVFGDSFSEDVFCLPKDTLRTQYVQKYLNGNPYKIWQQVVAENIGYNYKNYAANCSICTDLGKGNSNDAMFWNVCELSKQFKKNDIVIIGFTYIGRYEIFRNDLKMHDTVLPNKYLGEDTHFYHKLYVDRNNEFYAKDIIQKFKILETLSEIVGFKIFYWDWTNSILENFSNLNPTNWLVFELYAKWLKIIDIFDLCKKEYKTIEDETDGIIKDGHWGNHNNEILGNIFSEYINKTIVH